MAVALTGCGAPSSDRGFGDVQALIAQRTGKAIRWNTRSSEDAQSAAAVAALLGVPLTADSAAQVALLNSPGLAATFEELGIAQADLVQAGLLRNPVFDLSVRFPNRSPSKTYVDLAVAESFLDVFLIPARKKIAAAQFEAAKARVVHEVLALVADTKSAFLQCQSAQQLLELHQTVAEAASASLDAARRLREAGNINELAYLNEAAQESRAKVEAANADSDLQEARERLTAQLGLQGEQTGWSIQERLADMPSMDGPHQSIETLALSQRADLAAARQDVEMQARMLGLTRQTRFFASADAGVEAERETDGQWRIGPSVSLPLPIFDQGQAAVPRALALFRQSQRKYAALAAAIRSQVRLASVRMTHARSRAMFYHDEVLPLQQRLLEQTQLQYNGMIVGVFQLLATKRDEVEAAQHYIESLRDYWMARAELERAAGGKLPPEVPPSEPTTQTTTQAAYHSPSETSHEHPPEPDPQGGHESR